jgi:hypothetical protein
VCEGGNQRALLQVKLSASGQEIGGEILFKRRVGFSGTPSALLPRELGETRFEKGADGLMVRRAELTAVDEFSIRAQKPWSGGRIQIALREGDLLRAVFMRCNALGFRASVDGVARVE